MAIPTFVQKSRINQVIYQIRDGRLSVSERELIGKFEDHEFDLGRLDPDYQPRITRNYLMLIVPLILAAICGVALWSAWHQTLIPHEAAFYLYQWPAMGFAVFLATAIRGSRRIEYYQFNNRAGKPFLSIIREPEQAEECAAFIATLVAHIEIAQANLSTEQRAVLLRSVGADRPFTPASVPALALWKMSIVLGALSVGLPLLPKLDYYLAGFLFPIVFTCCVGGAGLCVFSFTTNEPKRWWSVLGLVFALIPPFFY